MFLYIQSNYLYTWQEGKSFMITVKNTIISRNYVNIKKIDIVVSVFLIYFPEQNYTQEYLCDKSIQVQLLFSSA